MPDLKLHITYIDGTKETFNIDSDVARDDWAQTIGGSITGKTVLIFAGPTHSFILNGDQVRRAEIVDD